MNFLALHDDVKFIIATHLASDLKIRAMLSKNHDIQKILFNEVVYNDDLYNYINLKHNAKGRLQRRRCRRSMPSPLVIL